jgi:histidyl-tRNA synthetase
MLRRRWIEDAWRDVATRHGFEEIDGPRFEHLDLYTVKSGDGIVSELFSFSRHGGKTEFALRPEFTPTVARMVAARASGLPRPTKWFSVGPYFRAERPQRGRLREFLQWNVDIFGEGGARADAELVACCVDLLGSVGLTEDRVEIRYSHRAFVQRLVAEAGVAEADIERALGVLDKREKLDAGSFEEEALGIGLDVARFDALCGRGDAGELGEFGQWVERFGIGGWCRFDPTIVRGLAYYTGMVFEVHESGGKERAIAGGGRYDQLVELFGGPSMEAVGFAMGDVVLGLVLEDGGLVPEDASLRALTGQRIDAFVICNEATSALLEGVVARLRFDGLHARHSYKATRNMGKLMREASASGARFVVILESEDEATLKAMDRDGSQERMEISKLGAAIKARTEDDR